MPLAYKRGRFPAFPCPALRPPKASVQLVTAVPSAPARLSAVHRLTAWYREGKDVQKLLPLLSTYMGHSDIGGTQRYLTMTPELLQQAGVRFANYAFSEVGHG